MKYALILISILASVLAQVFIKKASFSNMLEKRWLMFMALSLIAYGVAFLLLSYVLRYFPFSKIAPVMAIAIMILVFTCGIWLFGEIVSLKQIVGILLGVIAIYLILG